jgi:hypothetical protein
MVFAVRLAERRALAGDAIGLMIVLGLTECQNVDAIWQSFRSVGWSRFDFLPGLKIQTWGTRHQGFFHSHPSDKNKYVARVGHPTYLFGCGALINSEP